MIIKKEKKWLVALIADNFKTTHPQITLHPVATQPFILFYTEIFDLVFCKLQKHLQKNSIPLKSFFSTYAHPHNTNCD